MSMRHVLTGSKSKSVMNKLTDDRVAEIREIFCTLDYEKANCLKETQVRLLLKAMGYNLPKNDVRTIMQELGDGEMRPLEFEQVIRMAEYFPEPERFKYMQTAFNMIDTDQDGYVDEDDVVRLFRILGEPVEEEEIRKLINETSVFGRDRFNLSDFVIFMMKL